MALWSARGPRFRVGPEPEILLGPQETYPLSHMQLEFSPQICRKSHNHWPYACQNIAIDLLDIMEDAYSLLIDSKTTDSGVYSASLRQYARWLDTRIMDFPYVSFIFKF